MAKNDDEGWKRRRDREREREEEEANDRMSEKPSGKSSSPDKLGKPADSRAESSSISPEQLADRMQKSEVMMEQLNSLYNMYLAGVEKFPPLERRKQLEELMTGLQWVAKPTQAIQFRFTSVQQRFLTYRERWDKLMKDLESGKIKRRT